MPVQSTERRADNTAQSSSHELTLANTSSPSAATTLICKPWVESQRSQGPRMRDNGWGAACCSAAAVRTRG